MSKANVRVKVKSSSVLSSVFKNLASGITGVYVFLILAFFPIYTHEAYFDILGFRYALFSNLSLIYIILLLSVGLLYLILDYNEHISLPSAIERFVNAFNFDNIKKYFRITDLFFCILIVSMCISTAGSGEVMEAAMFGHQGRYQGLQCWIIYFLIYLAISRTFRFKKIYFDFALIIGCFACMWGTTDYFNVNIFGFFNNVSSHQQTMFASSIGNLNTYTNYTIMIFAIAGSLFIVEKDFVKSIFYLIASLISCTGTIFGLADNAVLGFAAFFIAAPFFLKTLKHAFRYFILICVLFLSIYLLWLSLQLPHNWGQGSFLQDLVKSSVISRYIFIPFILLAIILYFIYNYKYTLKSKENNEIIVKDFAIPFRLKIGYFALIFLTFSLVVYILLDVNVFKTNDTFWKSVIPSSHQLVFNDDWGTHRGHNWRIAFTNFTKNFSWFQRLFGYGPDTYQIVSRRTFQDEMVRKYGEVYDSAHNEYINFLICEGAVGLISYLGILIGALVRGIKQIKNNPFIMATVLAVIVYASQAFVNIAIPITTPVYFVLLFICCSDINNVDLIKND